MIWNDIISYEGWVCESTQNKEKTTYYISDIPWVTRNLSFPQGGRRREAANLELRTETGEGPIDVGGTRGRSWPELS